VLTRVFHRVDVANAERDDLLLQPDLQAKERVAIRQSPLLLKASKPIIVSYLVEHGVDGRL
jgi:hypothetical protein